jgi:hypothetical protein
MIAWTLIAALSLADPPPPPAEIQGPVIRRPVMGTPFVIPEEIAPAVVLYLECLNASAGITMYRGNMETVIPPPPGITKGSDCSATRKEAADQADRLLKARGHRDAAERKTFIARALDEADHFVSRSHPAAQPQN